MSTDPLARLPHAFGELLLRRRHERKWSVEQLATSADLAHPDVVTKLERGDFVPSLIEFFRIARAFGEQPTILLTDIIAAWRTDPNEYGHQCRAADFARLYRLGYHHGPGDFREQLKPYGSIDGATADARSQNSMRQTKGLPPLDTVLIYVRLGYAGVRTDADSSKEEL
jgi:transcriptional regulator with XRE-family HTH domain